MSAATRLPVRVARAGVDSKLPTAFTRQLITRRWNSALRAGRRRILAASPRTSTRGYAATPRPDPSQISSQPQSQDQSQQPGLNTQLATPLAQSDSSDLISEVRIPVDHDGVLASDHPVLSILGNSSIVIQRQVEMMNVMLGFEQANRYIIMDGHGQTLGYIAEVCVDRRTPSKSL